MDWYSWDEAYIENVVVALKLEVIVIFIVLLALLPAIMVVLVYLGHQFS